MKTAIIASKARTPIGSFLGSLSSLPATKLGSLAIKACLDRAKMGLHAPHEVIMGQVLQGGVGQAPARQAALGAGLPSSTPCTTVNKVCGSGLKAVMMASDAILLGHSSIVVAGGMESMSNAPYMLKKARTGFRMGNQIAEDLMLHDGLLDPYGQAHMGNFGDKCASEFKISREEQDNYAHESYRRAIEAFERGWFKDEIVPVPVNFKEEERYVTADEELSRYQRDKVATLKAAFSKTGTVTVANASKISDGAASLVIVEGEEATKRNLFVEARIIHYTTFAHDPEWFTTAPMFAIKKLLNETSLSVDNVDLFEINEAFSVVALAAIKGLSLKPDRVNVFGGAVALGHPIGCTGTRLLVTLLNALQKKDKRLGLVSLCLGGGEAVAMLIEYAGANNGR